MFYHKPIIKILIILILAFSAFADSLDVSASDTLLLLKNMRPPLHKQPPADSTLLFNPFYSSSPEIFRSDGVSASEILRYNALGVYVPFTLSGSFNRFLPFGNSAPLGYLSSPLSPALKSSRFAGSDHHFSTLGSGFIFDAAQLIYEPYPHRLAAPETVIFWENGVFEQNTFNLRLSRPMSPNLMLSAFSNYRYFKGKRFSHEGSGVLDFYRPLASDTSFIMNRGYNPLVDELNMGGSFLYINDDESKWRAGFSYSNFSNEYALDSAAQSIDRLHWALLEREIYQSEAALLDKKIGPFTTNFKAAIGSESYESLYPPDTNYATGKAQTLNFMGAANIAMNLGKRSRVGFTIESAVNTHEFFDGREELFIENTPQLVYSLKLPVSSVNSEFHVSGGVITLTYGDTTRVTPKAKASAKFSADNARLTLFAKTDGIVVYPDYDIMNFRPFCDDYVMLGGDLFLHASYGGILLGYQFVNGTDPFTVNMAWPMGIAPYPQPNHTFIIAPGTSRIKGFSLLSKAMISGSKPYIKASGNLSYTIQPRGMFHSFEAALGMDYWSERDPAVFANLYGWNNPIYDLNLKLATHIKSFRLFYKMDNMLNMRHAYVPGYFSPGLTFRWGVNWFIQR
ncbi:MAG: hypothetical protein LBB56_04590 [Chitinispirillales bacterium]|jgi:hypothetical protein|nr:hypothetical protein [Chitinispirillales bacterium]